MRSLLLKSGFAGGYIGVLGADGLVETVNFSGQRNALASNNNPVEVSFLFKVNTVADEDIGGDEGGVEDFDGGIRFIPCLAIECRHVVGIEKSFNVSIAGSTQGFALDDVFGL